jgi:hypothetical protein
MHVIPIYFFQDEDVGEARLHATQPVRLVLMKQVALSIPDA